MKIYVVEMHHEGFIGVYSTLEKAKATAEKNGIHGDDISIYQSMIDSDDYKLIMTLIGGKVMKDIHGKDLMVGQRIKVTSITFNGYEDVHETEEERIITDMYDLKDSSITSIEIIDEKKV